MKTFTGLVLFFFSSILSIQAARAEILYGRAMTVPGKGLAESYVKYFVGLPSGATSARAVFSMNEVFNVGGMREDQYWEINICSERGRGEVVRIDVSYYTVNIEMPRGGHRPESRPRVMSVQCVGSTSAWENALAAVRNGPWAK